MKLRITISKYHLSYLCQISLQIMLLPILTGRCFPCGCSMRLTAKQMRLPRLVSSTSFDLEEEANIYRRCWKEGPKIRKLIKFNGDTSKDSQDIAPQSHEILQTFVWWGHDSTLVSSSFVCLATINLVLS